MRRCYLGPGVSRWIQFTPFVSSTNNTWGISWVGGGAAGRRVGAPTAGIGATVLLEEDFVESSRRIHLPRLAPSFLPTSADAMDGLRAIVMDRMPDLYAAICEAGAEYGIADVGVYSVNSLRMEKCYRGMGGDLTNEISPIEAGLERFVDMKKGAFVGRDALERIEKADVALELVYLEVDALDADCMGGEPIHASGRVIGVTTSGGFGHRIQKSLAFAYVEPAFAKVGTQFEVEVLEDRRMATVLESKPAYDPTNERLRA